MNTLLVAFGLAIAGMNSDSNSAQTRMLENNSAASANHIAILAETNGRLDLNSCFDDPDFARRQLEMRSREFGPLSGPDRTVIG